MVGDPHGLLRADRGAVPGRDELRGDQRGARRGWVEVPDGTEMEVWRPSDEFHSFFTTGPVVGFRVDDAEQARARMEAADIEFIGPVQHSEDVTWTHFRGPDGNIYEIYQ